MKQTVRISILLLLVLGACRAAVLQSLRQAHAQGKLDTTAQLLITRGFKNGAILDINDGQVLGSTPGFWVSPGERSEIIKKFDPSNTILENLVIGGVSFIQLPDLDDCKTYKVDSPDAGLILCRSAKAVIAGVYEPPTAERAALTGIKDVVGILGFRGY